MSGVQIVRKLQADGTGKTRYVNIPTYLPPSGSTQAMRYQAAQARQGDAEIEGKIRALESATSKSKKSSAVKKHKLEWLQESKRLAKLREELDGELQEVLERLEQDRDPAAAEEEKARGGKRPAVPSKQRPDADESVELEEEGAEEEAGGVDMAKQLAAIDFECTKARMIFLHELLADVEHAREAARALAATPGGPALARRQLEAARRRFDACGAELAEEEAEASREAATVPPLAAIEAMEAPPPSTPPRPASAGEEGAAERPPSARSPSSPEGGGGGAAPDRRLAAHFVERFSELDVRHIGQLKALKEELEAAEAAARGPDPAAWDEAARFHFRKIFDEYEKKGLGRDACCERLAIEMPDRRRPDIEAYHDAFSRQRYYNAKRRAALGAWAAARDALAREAEKAFEESVREGRERAEREAELRAFEERRGELRERLRGMQAAAEERARQLAELERRQAEEDARRAEASAAEEREAREARKRLIAEFKAAQAAEQERMRAAEEEARRAEEEEARVRVKANAPRVAARAEEREQRRAAEREKERERERERAEREARLARLRETVAPRVESDPARILRPTAAMTVGEEAAAAAGPSGAAARRELFPVHGYTVDQLFADTRFRLTVALKEAGLDHTAYAQEMIQRAAPRTMPRVDAYTTPQLDAMLAPRPP